MTTTDYSDHWVLKYAPTLWDLAERMEAAGPVYVSSAGPQPQAKDYDPDEEPYFFLDSHVGHPGYTWPSCQLCIRVTTEKVETYITFTITDGGQRYWEDVATLTHDELIAYLGSLPKRIEDFAKGETP